MQQQLIFGISVLLGFVVWGLVGARYFWPALRGRSRAEALRPLLLLHAFRFVGLAFLVPGVVSPELPAAFARPAAYGDLATSVLAIISIATLGSGLGTSIVWLFSIVGTVDLTLVFRILLRGDTAIRQQGVRKSGLIGDFRDAAESFETRTA